MCEEDSSLGKKLEQMNLVPRDRKVSNVTFENG
jgi:hypothetical protein